MTLVSALPSLTAVRAACASVNDPEFGLSIDDLGLIYDISVQNDIASIALTLTTPTCPAGDIIVDALRAAVAAVPGIREVDVRLVWEPMWTPEMISAQGRAQLGWRS